MDLGRKRELAVIDDDGFRGVGHGGTVPADPARNRVRLGDGDAGMTLSIFSVRRSAFRWLWFSLAGDADGGDGFGDADADGPLHVLVVVDGSFVLGFFGLTGLLLGSSYRGLITLLVAIITAIAVAFNRTAFVGFEETPAREVDHVRVIADWQPISGEHRGKIILARRHRRADDATPVDGSTIDPGDAS